MAVTILASVTLLPALLGFAGERVELTRWRRLIAAGLAAVGMFGLGLKIIPLAAAGFALALVVLVAGLFAGPLKREVPMQAPKPKQETFAYRWSRVVQHRPWVVALGATVVLLVLTVPVLSLRLCFSDESKAADDTTTKKAYDLIVDGFGPGYSGPLLLAAETPTGTTPDDLEAITAAVDADRGVAFVSPPSPTTTTPRRCGTWCQPPARRRRPPRSWSTGCETMSSHRSKTGWGSRSTSPDSAHVLISARRYRRSA